MSESTLRDDEPEEGSYVGICEVSHRFGRPGEGGWWFDSGHLIGQAEAEAWGLGDVAPAHAFSATERDASEHRPYLETLEVLIATSGINEGRHEPHSMLCDGWLRTEALERTRVGAPGASPTGNHGAERRGTRAQTGTVGGCRRCDGGRDRRSERLRADRTVGHGFPV